MIATRALRKGRFFVCSSKRCPASSAPHPTAPNRHVTGALLCKISRYISKQKSLYRRLQGPYNKACKMQSHFAALLQLQITYRATAQSKTQQKRQDRILFTALVHDQALIQVISAQSVTRLIRVRFSRLCIQFLPMPGGRFLHPPGFCNSVNYRSPVLTHNFTHNAILLHFTQLFVFSKII